MDSREQFVKKELDRASQSATSVVWEVADPSAVSSVAYVLQGNKDFYSRVRSRRSLTPRSRADARPSTRGAATGHGVCECRVARIDRRIPLPSATEAAAQAACTASQQRGAVDAGRVVARDPGAAPQSRQVRPVHRQGG
eukprot:4753449-Prymnesium_polylepis.1